MRMKSSDDWIPVAAIAVGAVFGLMAVGSVWGLRTHDAHRDALQNAAPAVTVDAGVVIAGVDSEPVSVRFLSVEPADRIVRLRDEDGVTRVIGPGQEILVSGSDFFGTFSAAGYEGDISIKFEVERPDGRESVLSVSGASPGMSLTDDGARVFSGPGWMGR